MFWLPEDKDKAMVINSSLITANSSKQSGGQKGGIDKAGKSCILPLFDDFDSALPDSFKVDRL